MSEFVNGYDDGTNGGIVTKVVSSYGMAHVEVLVPKKTFFRKYVGVGGPGYDASYNSGRGYSFATYLANVHEGFIARDAATEGIIDESQRNMKRFTLMLTVTGAGIKHSETFRTMRHHFDMPLPRGFNGALNFAYSVVPIDVSQTLPYQESRTYLDENGQWAGVTGNNPGIEVYSGANLIDWHFNFTSFSYTPPNSDRIIEVMGTGDAPVVEQIAIPDNSTSLRLAAYGAAGVVGKLMDDVALEIPVSQWLPQMLLSCDFPEQTLDSKHMVCRYVDRANGSGKTQPSATSTCTLRRCNCDGYRTSEECSSYKPAKKCPFLLAKEVFDYDAAKGTLQINDEDVKYFLNLNSGLGYIPFWAWRGARPDWDKQAGAAWEAITQAPMFYCHRFENAADHPHALPCYARYTSKLPWALVGQNNFWRYVRSNDSLDLSCIEKNWKEAVLKNIDVAATNPQNTWVDEKTILASEVVHVGKPDLAPATYLPLNLPEGNYEVWAYVKNTSGLPLVLTADYPRKLKHKEHTAKWFVPASAEAAWVQLVSMATNAAAAQLSGGARLCFGIENGAGGNLITGATLNNGGEFSFVSLYIERI